MLLGRTRERRLIDHTLEQARTGTSAALVLVGEPGIGKTALLDDAAERATGLRLLRARGIESEAQIPFASLLELLRPALGLLDRLPAPQAMALEGALALRPGRAQERFAVGAATLSVLAAYAEAGPVAVLVDDAHWLDDSSAQALLFAFRRLVADPIAVLVAVRDDEPSLLDAADLPRVRIGGLTSEEAQALVPGLDARLQRATAGNPLALLELAAETPISSSRPRARPSCSQRAWPAPSCAGWTGSTRRRAARWCSRRRATAASSACSPAPARGSGSRRRRSSRPRARGSSRCGPGRSSSAIRSRARPSTRRPQPASAARPTAPSRPCCRTATSTGAPGTSPPPPSARTTRRRPRSSRPACAGATAAPIRPHPRPSSVRRGSRATPSGRRGCSPRPRRWRGSAGSPNAPSSCST